MRIHEIGKESSFLEEIRKGLKTVEGRLAKPRFKKFRVGDRLRIREDVWSGGRVVASRPTKIEVEITKIERFPSFTAMLAKIDLKKALPGVETKEEALTLYRKFYSEEDEKKFGVIAFHFKLL